MTTLGPATKPIPLLYPVYISYKAQHRILSNVQSLLEECCYAFAQRTLSDVLVEEQWECPESVELTSWIKILKANKEKLSTARMAEVGDRLTEILQMTSTLRHTAVHRLRTSAKGIEMLVKNAQVLTQLLDDDVRARRIEDIHRELQSSIGEMQRNKDLLEVRLSDGLKGLARRRAELDMIEQTLVDDMLREDRENQRFVGAGLYTAVARLEEDLHGAEAGEASSSTLEAPGDVSESDATLDTQVVSEPVLIDLSVNDGV